MKAHSCCGSHHKGGDFDASAKLAVSALFLLAGFLIAHFGLQFPFFPYTDPSWIAVFLCSGPIFSSAFRGLFVDKKINTSMLVSLAMIASFGLQIMGIFGVNVSGGHHESYIFVVGEIAFLMALGSWLEDRTLAKTAAGLEKISSLMPKTARVLKGNAVVEIPAADIKSGDIVYVNSDEMIAADGIIVRGSTTVDQSNMTGESLPIDKNTGDSVLSGTFNKGANIEIRATKNGDATVVSRLIELVEEAEGKRAPIARVANKWASYIVPTAIATSAIVFAVAFWLLEVGLAAAIVRAVTVLVVFCPCAFVLATPTAISAGIGNAARRGILIRSGAALEELSKVDTVFFDKTGTLTRGVVKVSQFKCDKADEAELLKMAAAVEFHSGHPLAKAIVRYAEERLGDFEMSEGEDVRNESGSGVGGIVNGKSVIVKKSAEESNSTVSEMFVDGKSAAKIFFSDELRERAAAAIAKLKADSYKVAILSGDNAAVAKDIAKRVGVENVYGNLLPQDKMEIVKKYRRDGAKVCMVGDGVNDAPSLAVADVSIAVADLKNDIAVNTAQISLINPDIEKIPAVLLFSKSVMRTIGANIILSLSVSFTAIVLSVFGFITPAIGALIHNASSVSVVLNSARLLTSKKLSDK